MKSDTHSSYISGWDLLYHTKACRSLYARVYYHMEEVGCCCLFIILHLSKLANRKPLITRSVTHFKMMFFFGFAHFYIFNYFC